MPTVTVLRELDRWAEGSQAFEQQRSTLANVILKPDGSVAALGRFPLRDGATVSSSWAMMGEVPGVSPVSWPLMTDDLSRTARAEASRLSLFVLVAVVALCWWAHRSWKLVMLNLAGLGIAIVGLLTLLRITGQSMTVMSLMSVPLLIGLIIDISLHLVLGLEEHDGDLRRTFRHMAAPVVLTGVCTMIGFGAPMLTAQPALQNFGMVMDMGILAAVTTGLVILPANYGDVRRRPHYSRTLYQARIFEAASWVGRVGGRRVVRTIGGVMGFLYDITHPAAAATLQQNLAVLRVEPIDKSVSHQAIRNYGRALGDYFLLGTRPRDQVMALCGHTQGLEYVQDVLAEGKGLVMVTVHLGLFEYGGLLLDRLDHSMTVLTLPEPSRALSEWRAAYRKRWGVETIEVGEGYFGSVEAVRELKRGNCVAMLADRPYDNNAVAVPFPNGTVRFSTGPAWLSLLSGSPIVAVSIVTDVDGRYRVVARPPLRPHWMKEGRDATVAHFTRELGKQFQQVICEHPDQWYQFVPLSR
jgi:lauroyl/myristoyl acyltransferase